MKCDHCCQENGKRSRCPRCDAMVCRECVNDHSESHNQLNPIRTWTEVTKKTIAEIKLRGEPRSYFASGPPDVFIENANGVYESLKKYLAGLSHPCVPQGPGKIFATTPSPSHPRMNPRNRCNHLHSTEPYHFHV